MFKSYNIPDIITLNKIIGENPTLKFSSAFNLNNPFELKFNINLNPFAEGQEEAFFQQNPGSSKNDFWQWQQQVSGNDGFTWHLEQNQRYALFQSTTICSFTDKNNNSLMWSHYTNNHRGICVKYSHTLFDMLSKAKGSLGYDKVQYSDTPPLIDTLESPDSKIKKMIFNKQSEWQYEQEHRVVLLSNNDTDFVPIEHKYFEGIYIGSKADKETTSNTIGICNKYNIPYYYGITNGKTYEVEFRTPKENIFYMRDFWI